MRVRETPPVFGDYDHVRPRPEIRLQIRVPGGQFEVNRNIHPGTQGLFGCKLHGPRRTGNRRSRSRPCHVHIEALHAGRAARQREVRPEPVAPAARERMRHFIVIVRGQFRVNVIELRQILRGDQQMDRPLVHILEVPAGRGKAEPHRLTGLHSHRARTHRKRGPHGKWLELRFRRHRELTVKLRTDQIGIRRC